MHTRMTDWLTIPEEVPTLPPYASHFAKKAAGGGSDEDDEDSDDEDDDDSDDDDDEDDDDPDADKSDEELKAELKAIRASLEKANGQSAARRRKLRERDAELEEERKKRLAKPAAKKDDAAPDLDAIRAEAREEAKREAKLEADNRIKKSEARSALIAAGVSSDVAADLIGFVKFDDLDVEGDEVEGLDDEIARIKKKYPSFFMKARTRRDSVAGAGTEGSEKGRKKTLTTDERQAQLLTRSGR